MHITLTESHLDVLAFKAKHSDAIILKGPYIQYYLALNMLMKILAYCINRVTVVQ